MTPKRLTAAAGIAAIALLLAGAGKPVPPPLHFSQLNVANGCFVESVCFYDQFRERCGADAWVRVLQWGAKEDEEVVAGHAVAVFELKGGLWAWDVNHGYLPLEVAPAQREDAERVSAPVLANYPRIVARYPLYRFDFPQEPDGVQPAVVPLDAPGPVRDAAVVVERLAKHRPARLIQYTYVRDGEKVTSAVAVFLFHGRLCIYFPESGTVPFLARQKTVANLRLLQECIRRRQPGAVGVKILGAD